MLGCAGCGGATPSAPTAPSGAPPPSSVISGRIDNPETVADLLTYNQDVNVGFSLPVEGRITRAIGVITRWELPVPVFVDPSISRTCVTDALTYWQSVTGLSFTVLESISEPRLDVRAAPQTELNVAGGSGVIYRTYPNNRAQLGVVRILASEATLSCSRSPYIFRHELGHTLGIMGHIPAGGLMAASGGVTNASQREINMLVQLYRLPHGTRVDPDGSWRVAQ